MPSLSNHQQTNLLLPPHCRPKTRCSLGNFAGFANSSGSQRKALKNSGRYSRLVHVRVQTTRQNPAMTTKHGDVKIFEGIQDLTTSLADYISERADAAVKDRGSFSIALSGGSLISTMSKLYEPPYNKIIDWSKWHVFWADERVVPRNHPDSNYKLAKDGLLSKVPIIPGQVYSINDSLSADAAAEDYEFGLRQLVKTRIVDAASSSDSPKFDLILLGMGPDGHIASLFPGHPLTHEKDKWIASIKDSPKPPPERITFTFPVINSAANVAMVITGSNKADVLQKAFGEKQDTGVLPVQMVDPTEGNLVWFLDKPAASKL
ncbi:hypothetical protein KP509_04G099200 [Ceratopteris richardii]|uniref:Probable 6-phosphogluconolactonase n=1 Tax=Ceratopteris richardii TaxID=49495 RepID=A0A8T2UZW7_CERRI|nr:hypothetical protein KP509_04G099200 [Ceratopteris richardii]